MLSLIDKIRDTALALLMVAIFVGTALSFGAFFGVGIYLVLSALN